MKPSKSILDESFTYVSSEATSVHETWRRFGWRPASEDERKPDGDKHRREHRADPEAIQSQ